MATIAAELRTLNGEYFDNVEIEIPFADALSVAKALYELTNADNGQLYPSIVWLNNEEIEIADYLIEDIIIPELEDYNEGDMIDFVIINGIKYHINPITIERDLYRTARKLIVVMIQRYIDVTLVEHFERWFSLNEPADFKSKLIDSNGAAFKEVTGVMDFYTIIKNKTLTSPLNPIKYAVYDDNGDLILSRKIDCRLIEELPFESNDLALFIYYNNSPIYQTNTSYLFGKSFIDPTILAKIPYAVIMYNGYTIELKESGNTPTRPTSARYTIPHEYCNEIISFPSKFLAETYVALRDELKRLNHDPRLYAIRMPARLSEFPKRLIKHLMIELEKAVKNELQNINPKIITVCHSSAIEITNRAIRWNNFMDYYWRTKNIKRTYKYLLDEIQI